MTCGVTTRREGDEYVCYAPGCGLRWGADEDRPPCPFSYVGAVKALEAGPVETGTERRLRELEERVKALEVFLNF